MAKINNIQPKQADTKREQLLLGFIAQEAEHIEFGKIYLELTIHDCKMTNVQSRPSKRSFNLNPD